MALGVLAGPALEKPGTRVGLARSSICWLVVFLQFRRFSQLVKFFVIINVIYVQKSNWKYRAIEKHAKTSIKRRDNHRMINGNALRWVRSGKTEAKKELGWGGIYREMPKTLKDLKP